MASTNLLLKCSVFVILSLAAVYLMRLGPAAVATADYFGPIAESDEYIIPDTTIPLRKDYTGLAAVDVTLSFLVTAFLPGAAGWDKVFQLQQIHFLFLVLPLLAVFSVESSRTRNARRVITFTSLWACFYQTVGGAIIIPLWFLFDTLTTSKAGYWDQGPNIPVARAKTLLPALLVGYLLPTVLMYLPYQDIRTQELMVAIWQPTPIFVNVIWWLLATISRNSAPSSAAEHASLSYLKPMYIATTVIAAVAHIGVITTCLVSSDAQITLTNVLIPITREQWSMSQALCYIFQADSWIIFCASHIWCCFAASDMHNLGLTTVPPLQSVVLMTAGAVIFGPGAALGATWYWREQRMYQEAVSKSKSS